MSDYSREIVRCQPKLRAKQVSHCLLGVWSGAALVLGLLAGLTGCQTPPVKSSGTPKAEQSEVLVLHEGDIVKITFPGAPNFNTDQTIRRDGRIMLSTVGEFKAAGLTPLEMEKELIKLYGPQLQVKEANVIVTSSVFFVYVSGAVMKAGKISSDRPINALEAIMEAGGFDYTKANLKAVTVIRTENGRQKHHPLNMKRVLKGEEIAPFNLQRSDIIYVPERFNWF